MHLVPIQNTHFPGLNPVALGWQDCPPGHSFGPAMRTYWLLHYVVSGCGTFQIEGKTHPVKAGCMFVIPPYVQTYYEADTHNPWNYIWVGFSYPGPLPLKLSDVVECPGALRYFTAMKVCEKFTGGRGAYLCAQIWELFAHLQERDPSTADCVDEALAIMHTEYANDLTATDLANRLNMDRSYFSTLFKKRIGVSPGKYLMDLRMRMAANLLAGGASVGVTAVSVGYADIYIFSKMFKRFYGMSPTQYIKART